MDGNDLSEALSSIWVRQQDHEDHGTVSAAALFERVRLAADKCRECPQLTTQRDHLSAELHNLQRQFQQLQQQARDREDELLGRIQQSNSELSRMQETIAELRSSNEQSINRNSELERELHASQANIARLERELGDAQGRNQALQSSNQTPNDSDMILHQFRDLCRPGWIVDRRELLVSDEVIGTGAYGSVRGGVWRACRVAVKAIHGVIMSRYNQRLFEREMYLYSLLSHPHLLKCFGACTDVNNVPLLILERMSTSLRAVLAQTGKSLSLSDGLIVIEAVAAALFYLHNLAPNPIVHRDLSSANVLLDIADSGAILNVKLSDFGSAHFVGQTQTNVPGAAIYSAPEVSSGSPDAAAFRPASDIYSFGVLVIEIFTGRQPDPPNRTAQLNAIRSRNMKMLAERCINTNWTLRPTAQQICSFISRIKQSQ